MKKNTLKISRANFPGVGNFSWMNYFHAILSQKYEVVIDPHNPDLVFYSNLHYSDSEVDFYTNSKNRGIHSYSGNVKKIFISGEANPDYNSQLTLGENHYCLGYEHITHPRYLRFPTYVLDAFVLTNEAGMFPHPFNWLVKKRNPNTTLDKKKHFCSVVQASDNPDRGKYFDLMSSKHFVKSSGPWRPTVNVEDALPNKHQYHNYSNKEYMGKIDGLTYRDKINFFKDSYFNLSFQFTNTDYLVQEKIVHSFAANSIPIFYGNRFIEDEGFNPKSFINVHSYNSFEDCFDYVDRIYSDRSTLKEYYSEPFFLDNKLPIYFDENYLLEFFDKIINK